MATPDGTQQEPGGYQLAVSYGPQVLGEGQQMLQEAFESIPHNGGPHEPGASQLAVYDGPQVPGGGQQMPQHLTIGTKTAFKNDYAYAYEKRQIDSETVYVCTKGSEWARTNEVLVLRYVTGIWIAYDSSVSPDGLPHQCRQAVFRCLATDITQPGRHKWQTNYAASRTNAGSAENWHGELWCETRVP